MICPLCTTINDEALSPSGRLPPQDWHPILCVGCYAVLVIDHAWPGALRPPDAEDWVAWHHDPRIAAGLARALASQTPKEDPDD